MIAKKLSHTVTSREFVYTNSVSAGITCKKRKSSVHNGQIRYEHSIWYTGRDSFTFLPLGAEIEVAASF